MQRIIFMALAAFVLQSTGMAQIPVKQPDGGGSYELTSQFSDEVSPKQRSRIIEMLQVNEYQLRQQGKISGAQLQPASTLFAWPIRQATASPDNGFYGISNYVDENSAYPNLVSDYNCGSRTYDLSSGYNHQGTDIFIWPFPWQKMLQNAVEIIAAAPGVIIGKTDNNIDTSCALCTTCDWNAVYIRHADGSVAWYGHMKKNSQTAKAIGQSVTAGEFLGVVGSSGSSTGPHLHFEVYTNSTYTQLVDPWAGPCNLHNGDVTWWASQEPYRVSTVNKIMTHGAPPVNGCYSQEVVNSKTNFVNGETIYLGSYYRDQLSGQQSVHTLYRPDNSVYTTWVQNFTSTFNASWWWYSIVLPNPATSGTWRYNITYNGSQSISTSFAVNSILPVELTNFTAFKNGRKVTINFNTNSETSIQHYSLLRSNNGIDFESIKIVPTKNILINSYTITDNSPYAGANYYKLEIDEKDGSKNYSTIKKVIVDEGNNYLLVTGNPFKNVLQITVLQPVSNVTFELINVNGQLVYKNQYAMVQGAVSLDSKLSPGVYLLVMKSNGLVLDKCTVLKQ